MMKRVLLAGGALVGLAYYLCRQSRRWGATDAEQAADLPGDDLLPAPQYNLTHAITIAAPQAAVWPWLVQMGFRRAGWYTDGPFSPIEHRFWQAIVPAEARDDAPFQPSARRIVPELQRLAVGDIILDGPPGSAYYTVEALEDGRHMVLRGHNHLRYLTPAFLQGLPLATDGAWSWAFVLREAAGGTRLLFRTRAVMEPVVMRLLLTPLLCLGTFINMRAMLRGIKGRAEGS